MSKDKKYLKKHVSAVRISTRIGLIGRKSWNILLLNAYDELLTERSHKISMSELCNLIGCNTRNTKHLTDVLEKLQHTTVKWDIGGSDIQKLNKGSVQLLGGYTIENGIIEYDYSPILSKMLHNPEIYAKINYLYQDVFYTSYGLALWENCLRFLSVGKTGFSDIQEWRELLGATAKSYDTYTNLSKLVLKPAIIEVNKVSNISIELLTKKKGRSVEQIAFIIKSKNKMLPINESFDEIKETVEYEDLLSYGLNKVQALKFVQEYKKDYIREKIDIVLDKKKKGLVKKSLSGLLVSAINEDWKSDVIVEKKKQQDQGQSAAKLAKEKKAEDQQKQFRTQCIKEVIAEYVENLSLAEKEALASKMAKEHPHLTRKGVADLYSPILWKPMQQEIVNFDELFEAKMAV